MQPRAAVFLAPLRALGGTGHAIRHLPAAFCLHHAARSLVLYVIRQRAAPRRTLACTADISYIVGRLWLSCLLWRVAGHLKGDGSGTWLLCYTTLYPSHTTCLTHTPHTTRTHTHHTHRTHPHLPLAAWHPSLQLTFYKTTPYARCTLRQHARRRRDISATTHHHACPRTRAVASHTTLHCMRLYRLRSATCCGEHFHTTPSGCAYCCSTPPSPRIHATCPRRAEPAASAAARTAITMRQETLRAGQDYRDKLQTRWRINSGR